LASVDAYFVGGEKVQWRINILLLGRSIEGKAQTPLPGKTGKIKVCNYLFEISKKLPLLL
jgi:hypothetical protein